MTKPIPWPRIITVSEAAQIAGKTPMTIHAWIRAGRLTGHQRGRVILIDKKQLLRASAPSRPSR